MKVGYLKNQSKLTDTAIFLKEQNPITLPDSLSLYLKGLPPAIND